MPEEDKAPAPVAETTEVAEVKEEAAAEEKKDEAAAELGTDDLEERIATRVYDKVKTFFGEMAKASEDIQKMVSETVSAKAEEVGPTADEAMAEVEEVKPKRSHKLFARPGKRE